MTAIAVGGRYAVRVAPGALSVLPDVLPDGAEQVLVVYSEAMTGLGRAVADLVAATGRRPLLAPVPDAESAKTAAVAADLWARMGEAAFTRTDAVVAVGGGTVTDLGGFVAATWLRGVPVVQVPTTLLAMVDAAVGGKTGINTAEGKNLVGAFHEPVAVLCDLDLLASLPTVDLVAGQAEVLKAGFIADPVILDLVETDPVGAARADGAAIPELIERAIRVKADVVAADLRESFLREVLNYGHTFGHAIEQVEHYRWRHGEAVAVGMVYAAELSRLAGLLAPEVVRRHRDVLTSVGLPTAYRGSASWADLQTAMGRDKKTRGARLRFVVLEAIARPVRLEGPGEDLLAAAHAAVTG